MNIEQAKVALTDELQALLAIEQTARDAAGTVALDQTRVGRLSRMDALQAQQISKEGNRRRKLKIEQIRDALRRIERNEFGECTHCGDAIAPGRLEANPSAALCIACAEAQTEL